MTRAWDRLVHLIEMLGTAAFCVLGALVFLQVMFRFVLKYPAAWTEEMARYLLVWVMFLGSAVSTKEGTHLAASNLLTRLGPRGEQWSRVWVEACVLVCAASMARGSFFMTRMSGTETATSFIWLKMSAVFAIMPVCFALMAISSLIRLVIACRALWTGAQGGDVPCS